jgi:hypothetical protein
LRVLASALSGEPFGVLELSDRNIKVEPERPEEADGAAEAFVDSLLPRSTSATRPAAERW